jgi:uncharacterized protein YbjT (DUF2867 family)
MKKALIIGATGLVGSNCLKQLLDDTRYAEVVAFTRKKLDMNNPKLTNILVDFDKRETWAEYCRVDDVFSVMGTTIAVAGSKENFYKVDFTYPFEIAKTAKAMGAKQHILVSSLGADSKSSIFYSKVKGEIEEAVASIGFDTSVILQPSMLLGDRKENRPAEKVGQMLFKKLGFLFAGPLSKYQGIKAETVAAAMIYFINSGLSGNHVFENKKIIETVNS